MSQKWLEPAMVFDWHTVPREAFYECLELKKRPNKKKGTMRSRCKYFYQYFYPMRQLEAGLSSPCESVCVSSISSWTNLLAVFSTLAGFYNSVVYLWSDFMSPLCDVKMQVCSWVPHSALCCLNQGQSKHRNKPRRCICLHQISSPWRRPVNDSWYQMFWSNTRRSRLLRCLVHFANQTESLNKLDQPRKINIIFCLAASNLDLMELHLITNVDQLLICSLKSPQSDYV